MYELLRLTFLVRGRDVSNSPFEKFQFTHISSDSKIESTSCRPGNHWYFFPSTPIKEYFTIDVGGFSCNGCPRESTRRLMFCFRKS